MVILGGGVTGLQLSTWLEYLAGMDVFPALSRLTVLSPLLLGALGAVLIPIGVLSIVGGSGAVRRRHWRLAFLGCVGAAAFIPLLGLPAVVLVILSRKEFAAPPGHSRHLPGATSGTVEGHG